MIWMNGIKIFSYSMVDFFIVMLTMSRTFLKCEEENSNQSLGLSLEKKMHSKNLTENEIFIKYFPVGII